MSNLQSGIFLIGAGAAVLFAWWSGALSLVLDELTARTAGGAN